MLTHKQAIEIANQWYSVNTWADPGVWLYSFTSTGGVIDQEHRTNQLSYLDSLIRKCPQWGGEIEPHEKEQDLSDLKQLREYIAQCPLKVTLSLDDPFFTAYIEAALWSSTDNNGDPLCDNYCPEDIHIAAWESMFQECRRFLELHGIPEYHDSRYTNAENAGHDFWLTRNRHGAGFWDRNLPAKVGRRFTNAAHSFGECSLYVGDDQKIHVE